MLLSPKEKLGAVEVGAKAGARAAAEVGVGAEIEKKGFLQAST
jgi:hypothetical protein